MHAPNLALRESIMVVNERKTADMLRQMVSNLDVIEVDSYLHALGQITKSNVRAIAGRLEPMAYDIEPTIRALRKLAPKAKLIILSDPAEEPQAMHAVRLGMDDYMILPTQPDDLKSMINLQGTNATPANNTADSTPKAQPTQSTETPPPIESPEKITSQINPEPSPPLVNTSNAPLGDIDLVEHLLHKRTDLCSIAIKLIRQQTNDDTIVWQKEITNHTSCSAAIHYANTHMGYLIATKTSQETLSAYASWLSRWLMLQQQLQNLDLLAFKDPLTEIWNRRYFERRLNSILNNARQQKFQVTLMLFDIDNFKHFNDRYGHPAGDAILTEAAQLMQSMARKDDIVARIGGDEFAVIFWDAEPPRKGDQHPRHPDSVVNIARRYREAICKKTFPSLSGAPDTITISGGLASFPWDGQDVNSLIHVADNMLLESKKQGKNVITFGPGAKKACGIDQS